ncbi:MAG: L-threonylcarbamoyladenylate synthase [Planctomycetota bacterium]|nr:L-threonylcarbamoyladenylate synthase [Planctomycetota bacterium]
MTATVLDVYDSDDPQAIIGEAVDRLNAGQIVAFPTETVYGIAANSSDTDAVAKLFDVKSRSTGKPMSLAIGYDYSLDNYAQNPTAIMHRLARRCWPGPLTMVIQATEQVAGLSNESRELLAPNNWLGLRVPSNEILLSVLDQLDEPLVLTSANKSDQADATTAIEVAEQLDDNVQLILDGGPTKIGTPSTVIKVHNDYIEILRSGALTRDQIQAAMQLEIVIVCTGNTCRSPMAEMLLKNKMATANDIPIDQLVKHGIHICSAGIAANNGSPAADQAINVLGKQDLDLTSHSSQPLSYMAANSADLILTLSHSHQQAIVNEWPEFADKTSLLAHDGSSVSDPIGGSYEIYQQCATQIDTHLDKQRSRINNLIIPDQDIIREQKR